MLNQRQKNIVRDLESSKTAVSAKSLAQKYQVSIRTIRNDTLVIQDYARSNSLNFLHIPGVGLRIITDTLPKEIDNSLKMNEFAVAGEENRSVMIAMCFLLHPNPITYDYLSRQFGVSRNTVIEAVKKATKNVQPKLDIYGVRNKGLFIKGKLSSKIYYVQKVASKFGAENLYRSFLSSDLSTGSNEFCDVKIILDFTEHHLYLFVSDGYLLSLLVRVVLSHAKEQAVFQPSNSSEKIDQFSDFLEYQFHRCIGSEERKVLKYILSYTTDYSLFLTDQNNHDISRSVQQLIEDVTRGKNNLIADQESLKSDLIIHLKASIEAQQSGLPRDNPLLNRIMSSYPDEFQLVKTACLKNQKIFPLKFTDDEIGFLTLYFLRSFEKVKNIRQSRVMVVCNTGRPSAKLLVARLMNNIPNIHITAMGSASDLKGNSEAVKNVDFIISTIPLTGISKPYVTVSALLDEEEIDKVQQALWISKHTDISDYQSIDISSKDIAQKNAWNRHYEKLLENHFSESEIKKIIPIESAQMLGEIMMDTCIMISKLYPGGIPNEKYGNVSGIVAHIIMSVPRWQQHDLIRSNDDMELLDKHPVQKKIILDYLEKVSRKLGVFIKPAEAVAILRYCLF